MGAGQSKQQPPQQEIKSSPPSSVVQTQTIASTNDTDINDNSSSSSSASGGGGGGGCPMKNADGTYRTMPGFASIFKNRKHPPIDSTKIVEADQPSSPATATTTTSSSSDDDVDVDTEDSVKSSGCPVKAESRASWNILRRGGNNNNQQQQQYDVYSRPLPMDPTNNMPIPNAQTTARNNLPSPDQQISLTTERVKSTIPKGGTNETWVYPSPQMFYNALARKGKLSMEEDQDNINNNDNGDGNSNKPVGIEEDMESVVAIHNCMNEGTWSRILQWEKVLNPTTNNNNDKEEGGIIMPKLLKFCGRPTDLSPKAYFKHYLLSHPLPFDRHDWTVTRTNPTDGSETEVRYVIDYYHDEVVASEEAGSGLPNMNDGIGEKGRIKSLLVDVRPAADSFSEVWGRMVSMPLARRGCRSILECVLFKGHGSGRKIDFEPLPLQPSETLKQSLDESMRVWENIQRDAASKKGVGAKDGAGGDACASDSLEGEGDNKVMTSATLDDANTADQAMQNISKRDATKMAETFSKILSQCKDSKASLQSCSSEEECNRAFMGMTVCAGQYMCPLQHKSLLETLDSVSGSNMDEEMAEAKINVAMEVLGECVAKYDKRAGMAKKQHSDVFEKVMAKKS
jgi:cytochrome c heme-lyase